MKAERAYRPSLGGCEVAINWSVLRSAQPLAATTARSAPREYDDGRRRFLRREEIFWHTVVLTTVIYVLHD
jgi:hypothetical protein